MKIIANLAGSSFRPQDCIDRLKAAKNGTALDLEAEPSNKFDPKAIKVLIDRMHVGFIGSPKTTKDGMASNVQMHEHKAHWHTATLFRNTDSGEYRVAIEVE